MRIILSLLFVLISYAAHAQGSRLIQSSDVTGALGYTPVRSVQGMTGAITCGTGLVCGSQVLNVTGVPLSSLSGLGTGVATALGFNVNSAGAFIVYGGGLGTPSSGVATNLTGTASGLTAGNVTTNANLTGDVNSVGNATTLATVNANIGAFGSTTSCSTFTVNGKGLITAASAATCAPAIGSIIGLGTNVATALGVNIGSAGAPVLFNGAGGTPSSITLTNGTGLPTTALTGALQAAQEPAHTGGCTNSAGSLALSCTNNSSIIGGGATNTIVAGATGWVGVGLICNGTEMFCYLPQPQAGTITNLYVNVGAAPSAAQTYTVTMRKNASNQTITCTISGASATSCNDTTHSFAVVASDNVSIQIAASAGATTISVANFGFKIATTSP